MEQFNQEQLYGVVIQTMTAASQLPMVKVNREEFLKTRFKDSPYLDKIIADGPTAVFTTKALRKEAEKIINDMTTKTSLISFAAGLPGNPFTAVAAGTADIAQYFGFALNLSQQIAYLFGEDELFVLVMSFSILDVWRPTYFDNILSKTGVLPVFVATSSVKKPYDLTRHLYFIIKKK